MRCSRLLPLLLTCLALVACPSGVQKYDFDGDGVDDADDCDPEDASIYPGADDPYGDGIDQDCDGCPEGAGDGVDTDCDGFPANVPTYDEDYDCDDANPNTYPGAAEIQGDGIDQDCNGEDCIDADLDGYCEGPADCADDDPTSYLGAAELADGADNDCDGNVDEGTTAYDDDNDGSCEGADLDEDGDEDDCSDGSEPGDCDDADAALNLVDQDGDGHDTCEGDCDDFNQDVYPGAQEQCNGEDDDCDGEPAPGEVDMDMDGYMICEGDCEDGNLAVHPGDTDGDGFSLCDPVPDCDDDDPALTPADLDLDGDSTCEGDCDDTDPYIHLGADERCNGEDDDCDGVIPADEGDGDGDGWWTCTDCDDTDPSVYGTDEDGDGFDPCDGDCDEGNPSAFPGAFDPEGDGIDQNCDGIDGLDADGDGWPADAVDAANEDCDDSDPALNLDDMDGDGWSSCEDDCDDSDPSIAPDQPDTWGDGVDVDCDGLDGEDEDGDGWPGNATDPLVLDCDDLDPELTPADLDGDGLSSCDGDCDDATPTTAPGMADPWGDLVDSNCDGADGVDGDSDGWAGNASNPAVLDCDDSDPLLNPGDGDGDGVSGCGGDCNDGDPLIVPGAPELNDSLDNDCDGYVDECLGPRTFYVGDYMIHDATDMAALCASWDGVDGILRITNAGAVTNLEGMGCLCEVTGQFVLSHLANLGSFEGLDNLESVGALYIQENDAAVLDGFPRLETVTDYVTVYYNDFVEVSGFPELTTVGGTLAFNGNFLLGAITGFSSLTSVGGEVTLGNISPALQDISGLSSLDSVGGLSVSGTTLTDLVPLQGITWVGGDVSIQNNTLLPTVEASALVGAIGAANIAGTVTINNNGP